MPRAYTHRTKDERIATTQERLDYLKTKLVNKELRLQMMEEEILQLKVRIQVEELILRKLVPELEKASA